MSGPSAIPTDKNAVYTPTINPRRLSGASELIQNSVSAKLAVTAAAKANRSGNHSKNSSA